MAVAFLDTNVLFASASARDEYHDPARQIVREVDHGVLPDVIVTNYVVAETLNLTGEKLSPDGANEMLDRIIEGAHFEIDHAPKADFTAAQALFRRYGGLSFVDSTIAAYMQREGVEYLYSFDDDFDGVDWITRLATPDNPFA
jgi:hypothetical protein